MAGLEVPSDPSKRRAKASTSGGTGAPSLRLNGAELIDLLPGTFVLDFTSVLFLADSGAFADRSAAYERSAEFLVRRFIFLSALASLGASYSYTENQCLCCR